MRGSVSGLSGEARLESEDDVGLRGHAGNPIEVTEGRFVADLMHQIVSELVSRLIERGGVRTAALRLRSEHSGEVRDQWVFQDQVAELVQDGVSLFPCRG